MPSENGFNIFLSRLLSLFHCEIQRYIPIVRLEFFSSAVRYYALKKLSLINSSSIPNSLKCHDRGIFDWTNTINDPLSTKSVPQNNSPCLQSNGNTINGVVQTQNVQTQSPTGDTPLYEELELHYRATRVHNITLRAPVVHTFIAKSYCPAVITHTHTFTHTAYHKSRTIL